MPFAPPYAGVPADGLAPDELPLDELPLDDDGVVVEVVAALDALPANNAAPIAPPVNVETTSAAPMAAFRNGLMFFAFPSGSLQLCSGTRPISGSARNCAVHTSAQAWLLLGNCSDLER